jgi:signal peptidase II
MAAIRERQWISWAIAGVIIALDQLAKWVISDWIGPGATKSSAWLAGGWLGLQYTENRGVAFGLFDRQSTAVLLVGAVAVLAAVIVFIRSWGSNRFVILGGGLVIGGAIGNVIDRARLGYVRDFVLVGPWPSFNVADAAITCGVLLLVLGMSQASESAHRHALAAPVTGKRLVDSSE